MLAFLFGSTMFLVMIGALGMMWAFGRSKRFKKLAGWVVFFFALVAGAAAALCFVGDFVTWIITFVFGFIGIPLVLLGLLGAVGVVGMAVDLADGQPDGLAKTMALLLPILLAFAGGSMGLYGDQATGALSGAGAALFANLVGV
ncbi:hypothetical protein [Nocardiopsis dassonvillei]|uniref:hypothetical protein n=1 Tax=Nocardiopsis dassonvillei TaxID=2014 RepID=UPI00157E0A3D|nr:hypothetical protein [Nocardiopsis dassonvillei]